MAWVTFDQLVSKMSGEPEFIPGFGYSSRAGLSQQEFLQWGEMLNAAQEFAQQKGIQPDRPYSYVTDSGDFSGANYSPQLLSQVLKDNGMTIGLDPSRQVGNIGSSRGHTSTLGFLDLQGNVLGEFPVKEGSFGSGIMKGFVAPFVQMVLAGNTLANLISPGAVAAAGGIDPSVIGKTLASTAPPAVQSAVTNAVVSGSVTALSGGDAEDVIKNALIGGATGAIGELAKPYIQDAIDFVKDLTPEGLQDVVAAAGDAGDVAENVADVDVGGAVVDADRIGLQSYESAIAAGLPQQQAINAGLQEAAAFSAAGTSGELSGFNPAANANALANANMPFSRRFGGRNLFGSRSTTGGATAATPSATASGYGGAGDVLAQMPGSATGGIDLGAPPQLASMSPAAYDVYFNALAQGADPTDAVLRAVRAEEFFANTNIGGVADTSANALLGGGATAATPPANALASDPYAGLAENFPVAPVEFTPTPVAPRPGVAGVDLTAGQTPYDPYLGLAENFPTTTPPIIPPVADTGAGLGAAGPAAGLAGAGVAAGAAGTGAGIYGPGISATPGAGLDLSAATGTPGGNTGAIIGGTGITAGTTGGAGLDTSGLALGGALGAGAAAGSALPVGSGAAAGSALGAGTAAGAAAGLTGIAAVDDFLNYIGTPAGAAALGAFGSLAGGYLTGQAAKDAANIQAQSAQNALALQREQFEYQKGLLEPYRKAGESALGRLSGVMGLGGQPAQPQQLLDMDPGYAFRLGEGMKALERVQAARGNMLSGGAIKAGQRYAQDFASGEYGNAYNRLANIAGLGQTVGGQLGTAAQQFGQTAGETMSQGANALAAGRVGRMSGYMGGIGGAVGAYQNYQNQQQQNQLFRDIYGRMGG